MSNELIQKALARKAELEVELSEIDQFLSVAQRLTGESLLSDAGKPPAPKKDGTLFPDAEVQPAPERRNRRVPEILEAVENMLKQHTRPMRAGEILDNLTREGINVGGARPIANLSAMLSHDGRFESLGRAEGWALADGYDLI